MTVKLTIRSPQDFIAYAPIALGFKPENSVVIITIGGFSARVDLPTDDDEEKALRDLLLRPASEHGVKQAAFLVYADEDHDGFLRRMVDYFNNARITVVTALEVRGDVYRDLGSDEWLPTNVESNPLTLDAQFHGVLPRHENREAMRESIRPRGGEMTADELRGLAILEDQGIGKVLLGMSREKSKGAVAFWSGVLAKCELGSDVQKDVALLVAYAAWLSGDGAMSWLALDLADPHHKVHEAISRLLNNGCDPRKMP